MREEPIPVEIESRLDALAALTQRQIECLLLTQQGYQAKEIGAILGISYNRVNKLLQSARDSLGGMRRREAGRLVHAYLHQTEHESEGDHQMTAHLMGLLSEPAAGSTAIAEEEADAQTQSADPFAEAQSIYPSVVRASRLAAIVPFRTSGRLINDLSFHECVIVITILTTAVLMIAGSAASLLTTLNSLATG